MPSRENERALNENDDNLRYDPLLKKWLKRCEHGHGWFVLDSGCSQCDEISQVHNISTSNNLSPEEKAKLIELSQDVDSRQSEQQSQGTTSSAVPSLEKDTSLHTEIAESGHSETNKKDSEPINKTESSNLVNNLVTTDQKDKDNDNGAKRNGKIKMPTPPWLIAVLMIFIISIIGLLISLFLKTYIPLYLLFGFSCIFSIDRWFRESTIKHKTFGKSYRLLLNLCILALVGLLIWTGVKLFSDHMFDSSLFGSLIFIAELALFFWLWVIVSRNSWRWPSMKLTVLCVICLLVIFAFAGVQPISTYKDNVLTYLGSVFSSPPTETVVSNSSTTSSNTQSMTTTTITTTKQVITTSIASITPIKPPITTSVSALTVKEIVPGLSSAIINTQFLTIDGYALATPAAYTQSIQSLGQYLVKPAKNDFEKARSIYRWITQNISYDFSAYLSGKYASTSADDVFLRRSTVCQGYANLFEALAKAGGLEVRTLSGWAKGYSYTIGDQITGPTNHAWSALKINGGWYLIDCTWGAGYIKQQKFVRDFDPSYFLTPPDQFIYNHFPEDSRWQLLDKALSKDEYAALPYIYSGFFKWGIDLGNNNQSEITVKGPLSLTFQVASNTYLMSRIWQGSTELNESSSPAIRSGENYIINATFPGKGSYILSIYASDRLYGTYDGVLDYKVVVN